MKLMTFAPHAYLRGMDVETLHVCSIRSARNLWTAYIVFPASELASGSTATNLAADDECSPAQGNRGAFQDSFQISALQKASLQQSCGVSAVIRHHPRSLPPEDNISTPYEAVQGAAVDITIQPSRLVYRSIMQRQHVAQRALHGCLYFCWIECGQDNRISSALGAQINEFDPSLPLHHGPSVDTIRHEGGSTYLEKF